MLSQLSNATIRTAVLTILLLQSGCASYTVWYKKDRTYFTEGAPKFSPSGHELEVGRIPCHGGIEVLREHGLFWWPDGFYRGEESYGVYFKKPTDSSHDFYLSVARNYYTSPMFVEARGEVLVAGRSVLIDVEYKDSHGKWTKPAINGRHPIDWVLPDDRASAHATESKSKER